MILENDPRHPDYRRRYDFDDQPPRQSNVEQLAGCLLWIIYIVVGVPLGLVLLWIVVDFFDLVFS